MSEPRKIQLPPLPKPMTSSKHWDGGIDWPVAGERAARLEREDQLREAFERIARLEAERDMLRLDLYERSELVTAQNFAEMQQ